MYCWSNWLMYFVISHHIWKQALLSNVLSLLQVFCSSILNPLKSGWTTCFPSCLHTQWTLKKTERINIYKRMNTMLTMLPRTEVKLYNNSYNQLYIVVIVCTSVHCYSCYWACPIHLHLPLLLLLIILLLFLLLLNPWLHRVESWAEFHFGVHGKLRTEGTWYNNYDMQYFLSS